MACGGVNVRTRTKDLKNIPKVFLLHGFGHRFCIILLLTSMLLSGCGFYDRTYVVETDYPLPSGNESLQGDSVQVSDIQQLREAIRLFVGSGRAGEHSHRVVFSSGYSGSPTEDMAAAIWQVRTEDALCAYCVENISYELRQIISSVEADISIAYSAGAAPVEEIISMTYATGLDDVIADVISAGQERLVVLISRSTLTEDSMGARVEEVYRQHPGLAPVEPDCAVAVFSGSGTQRLYELVFQYHMTAEQFRKRKEQLDAILPEIPEEADEYTRALTAAELLYDACDAGAEGSIYAALVKGHASSEGIALGYTELCRRLGLECCVVNGQKNREDHCWNMVCIDGSYYHVDLFAPSEEGFLKSDASLWGAYRWTTSAYPQCEKDFLTQEEAEPEEETEIQSDDVVMSDSESEPTDAEISEEGEILPETAVSDNDADTENRAAENVEESIS